MANVNHAMQAKSDQLNFVDIGTTSSPVLLITAVKVGHSGQQDVVIHYQGDNGKPYKPNKGMIRVFSSAWGEESDDWVGKSVQVYGDPTVRWAGKEVGGIAISSLSNIDKNGIDVYVQKNRSTRVKVHFNFLAPQINEADQKWIDAIKKDSTVIEQITDVAYKNHIVNLMK